MFGMLDYRAAKLWLITFKLPHFVAIKLLEFGLIGLSYFLSTRLDLPVLVQLPIGLVIYGILSFPTMAIGYCISAIWKFTFRIFIDVVPADGRDKKQAWEVVLLGEKAIRAHTFLNATEPEILTSDLIRAVGKHDWVNRFFYYEDFVNRWEQTADFFMEEREYIFNGEGVENYMRQEGLLPSKFELFATNALYRNSAIHTLILISLYFFL